jgi:hypothetical protein
MADRRTRFSKGLKNATLYGTTTIDSSGTFAGRDAASVEAMVCGIASGDTSYDGYKVACGSTRITGSRDINTGLTTVISGSANVATYFEKAAGAGSSGAAIAICRISKTGSGSVTVSGTGGAGFMKIICLNRSASVEATAAASVDWFAIGT